jgi:uncharacterized protein (DUF934 family)
MLEVRKQLIKNRAVVDDTWSVLRLDEGEAPESVLVPDGKVIVPLAVWQAQRQQLASRAQVAVWLAAHERAEAIRDELDKFALVAVDFPKFSDGRGYSIAYNLRKRLGYKGELRAIGDVLRDQLFQMLRTGFDAFSTRPDRNIHDAVLGLTVFSATYAASVDTPLPLFRRVQRGMAPEADIAFGI